MLVIRIRCQIVALVSTCSCTFLEKALTNSHEIQFSLIKLVNNLNGIAKNYKVATFLADTTAHIKPENILF